MQYCSLQHRTLLLSPVTSTPGNCFCFGSIPSFFLELFLHWSPVAYWAHTGLGSSSFNVLYFCLFILFIEFSRQGCWSGLPFPSPADHILSDLSTVTRLSWVAPHGMAQLHWVRQDCGPVIRLASFLWFLVLVCLPSDALSQHLPSYLGFSYLGHGVSLHGCSSKAQPLLLTLNERYLLTATPPDLERGVAPISPLVPAQPPLLGGGVAPLGHRPWPRAWGSSSQPHFCAVCRGRCASSLVVQTVKNLPAVQDTRVWSLHREDPLEKGIATHSSILSWRSLWTEELRRLQSIRSQSWTRLSD